MALRLTGADAILDIAGTDYNIRNMTFEYEMTTVDATASGDAFEFIQPLRGRYQITGDIVVPAAEPYAIPTSLLGTEVDWAIRILDANPNGLFSGTGLLTGMNVDMPHDDIVTLAITIQGNGTAPTADLTPSS